MTIDKYDDKESNVFDSYVKNIIKLVEQNRGDPTKYVKNTTPDEVIPYRFKSGKDEDDGLKWKQ